MTKILFLVTINASPPLKSLLNGFNHVTILVLIFEIYNL